MITQHIFTLQMFDNQQIVVFDQFGWRCLQKIGTLISNMAMQMSKFLTLFLIILRFK